MTPPPTASQLAPAVVAVPLSGGSTEHASHSRLTVVLRDVAQLIRPRITTMVLVTVAASAWITSSGSRLRVGELLLVLLGTALVAASSSIVNQILESSTDRLMARTARRPLADGRMSLSVAWWLASALLGAGLCVLVVSSSWQPAVLAFVTWMLYVCVYTPMKRFSPLNTAVGAIAGALPVLIGWAAADGPARFMLGDSATTLTVAALGTVLYLWQFPHFMAIAWLYRREYANAGLRMLTVDDPSGLRAAAQSMAAALAMIPVSLLLAVPSGSIRLFLAAAAVAIVYAGFSFRFAIYRDDQSARGLLLASIGTLLALLTGMIIFTPLS